MDESQRAYGYVSISIEHLEQNNEPTIDVFNRLEGKKLWLVESKAFFEAYYHVLKTMQEYPN